jgi:cytochrome c oxidase cbb3-type subunit 4
MDLDINTIRGLITTVLLFSFLGMVFWAYSSKRKNDFSDAASLALMDEQPIGVEEKQP